MNTPSTANRGRFIGLRKDQLGARLLMILNCIRLSDDFKTSYYINWFPEGAAAPKLDHPVELFTDDYMETHFRTGDAFEALRVKSAPIWQFLADKTPDRLEAHLSAGGHVIVDEGFEVIAFPWEDAEDIRARYGAFVQRIDFQKAVADQMTLIDQAMAESPSETVAYHIRRGDILNERPWKDGIWPGKIEPDELYNRHIELGGGGLALVFSDQAESIKRFQKAYPNVRNVGDLADLTGMTTAQRDFLELYAMSRTTRIVAPILSAFSSAAARLSGRQRLRFVDVLTSEHINEAYDRIAERFHKGIDQFVNPSEAAHIYSKLTRHLVRNDRAEEAYEIGTKVIAAGADNAFLPMLQAVNALYMCKWAEAKTLIDQALESPYQWKEVASVSLAVRGHARGFLGEAEQSRQDVLRAFWLKPGLMDVVMLNSAMLQRHRLTTGWRLPFDPVITDLLRAEYQQRHTYIEQSKVLRKRAMDLTSWVVEWPSFVLDAKAQRTTEDKAKLRQMLQELLAAKYEDADRPTVTSYSALLRHYMGQKKQALAMSSEALKAAPDHPLIRKRHATMLMDAGNLKGAWACFEPVAEAETDVPAYQYFAAQLLLAMGKKKRGLEAWQRATARDDTTAAIHGGLGAWLLEEGALRDGVAALRRAAELAPTYQKFGNQADRAEQKMKNKKNRKSKAA